MNQYETQAMEAILRADGWLPTPEGECADAVIINSCAVTAESGRKSRQLIRRLAEENPGAVIGVCGCYSQLTPDACCEAGGNVVYGTGDHKGFLAALKKAAEQRAAQAAAAAAGAECTACAAGTEGAAEAAGTACAADALPVTFHDDPFRRHEFELLTAGAVAGRTRALLKIQDGCVNFCTYCIIPYTRGRLRSLSVEEAAAETKRLAAEGFRELVVTGIEVASYGVDLPGKPGLADVICAISENAGDMRIRLGSLEPTVITEDFCKRLSEAGRLCRHFHLSLQSGCDRTLKAMNRKYLTEQFFAATELLRKYFPGCGMTCDLITGFPGETEEDFSSTLAFIRKCAFSDMHIFPYSRRPGTPADKMPGQCVRAVKAERAARAQQVCNEMHREFLAASVGKVLPVLFETEAGGVCTGHSDTYVLVSVPGTNLRNRVLDVEITGVQGEGLAGRILNESV